ncbi:hypothetical protein O181_021471 [Austropuccinia psidii MF-1]|uniref:Protein kinase domain-containing protein n=1 Tax=Austropuccinia psidii MF-1 TaxID=1389203 RepID=A0A9Q3CB35_9BASI|nr:hypothetical protein [Austropuccinia psidii MF-1]
MSWLSALGGAATSLLSKGGLPNLPGFGLGNRDSRFDDQSIWTLYDGVKRDDNSIVSIFIYDSSQPSNLFVGSKDKKLILSFAKNHLKKLRSLRHPNILKFLDGTENEYAVYIVTEKVTNLSIRLNELTMSKDAELEWKIWGLSQVVLALKFINGPGSSTHGNLRTASVFITQSGEWRLSGFEILTSPKDPQPILYTLAGNLPDSAKYSSPETLKTGYDVLRDLDPSCLDSYQLYLLIQTLFNKISPSADINSQPRGLIPPALFSAARRLASANPKVRLKTEAFWEIGCGNGENGGGVAGAFFKENRLTQVCKGIEGFSLASQGERAAFVKSIKDCAGSLPPEFLKFKVLPSLVQSFDHSSDGPTLLPLALSISTSLSQSEFSSILLQPLVKLFASPDRAIRLSLLELLPQYIDQLDKSTVVDKIWPNVLTGFTDTVPVIREATVRSVLLFVPKLSERILNNDLLRYLAKTQMDVEPGIRTNTCILLGRLSKSLSVTTCRKVLIPAFTRSVRDSFTPARIAGLMALMATVEYYEAEDLAGKAIPGMTICLIDKEKSVRDQAFKALDMLLERVKKAAAEMPETSSMPPSLGETINGAISASQPGMVMSAAGAAGALAGWAFSSVGRKLTTSDLASSISAKTPSPSTNVDLINANSNFGGSKSSLTSDGRTQADLSNSLSSFSLRTEPRTTTDANVVPKRWGDDLMDVQDDADDWSTFETGPAIHEPSFTPLPSTIKVGLQSNKLIGKSSGLIGGRMKPTRKIGPRPTTKKTTTSSLVAALEADNELEAEFETTWGGGEELFEETVEKNLRDSKDKELENRWSEVQQEEKPQNPSQINRTETGVNSKEAKAAHMAKMKEERRAKMAALKAKKATGS